MEKRKSEIIVQSVSKSQGKKQKTEEEKPRVI